MVGVRRRDDVMNRHRCMTPPPGPLAITLPQFIAQKPSKKFEAILETARSTLVPPAYRDRGRYCIISGQIGQPGKKNT